MNVFASFDCFLQQGKPAQALQVLDPDLAAAADLRGRFYARQGAAYGLLGSMPEAAASYWEACKAAPDLRQQLQWYSNYLFCLHYLDGVSDGVLKEQEFRYGEMLKGIPAYTPRALFPRTKLRIGYLSPNFCDHVMARFIEPLFQYYDRERYEVFAYMTGEQEDAGSAIFRSQATVWRNISQFSYETAAERIHQDALDILFDLGGHSQGGHTLLIAAYRPAPIQLSGLGWLSTTGLPVIDYSLWDTLCVPEDRRAAMEASYTETILRLPRSMFCDTKRARPRADKRPGGEGVVFGCFNNFAKISQETLAAWREILVQVPEARLLLKDTTAILDRQQILKEKLTAARIPLHRVTFCLGSSAYLSAYRSVDISLDTFPYTGGATTCDALAMGTPVITRTGTRPGECVGASLLTAAGLQSLIAEDWTSYIEKAVQLAKDRARRKKLQTALPGKVQQSALYDGKNYCMAMEKLYERIFLVRQRRNEDAS